MHNNIFLNYGLHMIGVYSRVIMTTTIVSPLLVILALYLKIPYIECRRIAIEDLALNDAI